MNKPTRTLIEALYSNVDRCGSGIALRLRPGAGLGQDADDVTWGELVAWVIRLAGLLRKQVAADVNSGQRRLLHLVSNQPADVLIALACQAAGIVDVPIDADAGERFFQQCRERVGGSWLDEDAKRELVDHAGALRSEAVVDQRLDALPRPSVDDDALILWTSGTTGDPKGVVLSHRSLLLNAQAKLRAVPQSETDRRLTVLSIAHGYARTCDLGTWILSGCTLAITRGFDGWQQWAGSYAPTLCNMVPSLAERVVDAGSVPTSLRLLGCGGAAMTVDRFEQWLRRGVTVIQGYGLTEAGPVIASQTPDDSVPGYVGRIVSGWEHKIEQGRLLVRGPHVMSRYWDDPVATAARMDSAGWLDTGDLVEFEKGSELARGSGQLRILGRADDRIVLANGYKVDPHALEQRFAAIAGVRTAVICQKTDQRGVELWVEFDDSVEVSAELESIIRSLPRWEQPRQINRLSIPNSERERLFNRKGAIRRSEMLRFLPRATGSC